MRVSELVTIDEIKSWNPGDIITIKAGTGAGKSYFIKNNLYAIAKKNNAKILFLLHRINCINQFKQEISKDNKQDVIHIRSYQSIEHLILNNETFNFDYYDYIVCDEFHYFMSDAAFNITTDISLNNILKQINKIRLFMSATGDYMKKFINNHNKLKTIDYEIPKDYSFIDTLTFYNKDSTLDTFMKDAIKFNQKGIFFIESAEKAYKFYEKYQEYCLFNCSKSNENGFYKYVDQEKIAKMLKNEKFDELILITTTCFDTGVNIIDDNLKHIVCDVVDIGTIAQCIGRKRIINPYDKLNVYIKAINNKKLGSIKGSYSRRIKMARYLKENGQEAYVKEYQRKLDHSQIIYDDIEDGKLVKKINKLMYFKSIVAIAEIDLMISKGKYGYTKTICQLFGKEDDFRLLEENNQMDELETYLESIIGKRLFKEDQKKLINKIELKDKYGRIQKSMTLLNAYFVENKKNYLIVSKVTSELVDEKRKSIRYWEVINNVSN